MDKNLHKIEDLFRDNLENNKELPPPNVWKNIDNDLNKIAVTRMGKKYTAMKRLAAILFFLLLCYGVVDITTRQFSGKDMKPFNSKLNKIPNSNGNKNETVLKNRNQKQLKEKSKQSDTNNSPNSERDSTANSLIPNNLQHEEIIVKSEPGSKEKPEKTENKNNNLAEEKSNDYHTQKLETKLKFVKENIAFTLNSKRKLIKNQLSLYKIKPSDNAELKSLKINKTENFTNQILTENNIVLKNSKISKELAANGSKINILHLTKTEGEFIDLIRAQTIIEKNVSLSSYDKILNNVRDSLQKNKYAIMQVIIKKYLEDNALNKKKGKLSRLSFSLFYTPEYASYNLKHKPHNLSVQEKILDPDNKFGSRLSFSIGSIIDYKLNNKLSLQSGLNYTSAEFDFKPNFIYASRDVENNGEIGYNLNTAVGYGYILPKVITNPNIGDSLYAMKTEYNLKTLSIPLALKYNLTMGKLNLFLNGGISLNAIVSAKIKTEIENGSDNEIETINKLRGLNTFYIGSQLGIGVDYNLNKNLAFSLNPTYRFALEPINRNENVKSYPHYLGLSAGIKVQL